ncbi:MAG TPA: carboxypeptidase regulatory-like domain-containing protein [Pyrinomonadaceae bacterium]|nr:carboxypeptidase regulatory-like domain-containing protein [Pyrinomonadaceae bacterium]
MKHALLLVFISLFAFNVTAQTQRPARHKVAPNQSAAKSAHFKDLKLTNRERFSVPTPNTQLRTSNTSNSLPIRKVILYSNGVAYIERRGIVSGHAEVSLSFKQSQVDDVLKSMLVLDLGKGSSKGRIGAVSYNSSTPASARMAEIPFAISASTTGQNSNGGLAGVLSQLQGARVIVTSNNRTVTGSIITIEARHSQIDSNHPAVTSHRLVIASDNGQLNGFDLEEVRSIQLVDEGARRDLSEFAHAAASARRRDAKTIVVTSEGAGQREMIVSYTIAAPIWKTTYRLVLDETGQPFFQGWAIVDNISEEDWNGIELSLVSGTPISFIQPIQNPVYRYRPVVPLQLDLNLKPQVYEPGDGQSSNSIGSLGGRITDPAGAAVADATVVITNSITNQSVEVSTDDDGRYEVTNLLTGKYMLTASATGFQNHHVTDINILPGLSSKLDLSLNVGSVAAVVEVTDGSSNSFAIDGTESSVTVRTRPALNVLISQRQSGVEAETSASEIGDLFEYRIDQPVTVPRDRSALIPILQTHMSGERVSIFRATGDTKENAPLRPRSGLLLKNTSQLTLEDGSLTVLDGDAYAGEALLERLKPAEERLVSFALDLGTLVSVETVLSGEPTYLIKAVRGVIEAHRYTMQEKRYTLINQTDRARVVYLEHPVAEDWELAEGTPKPEVRTAKHYRFRVKLEPHQKLEYPVKERKAYIESYALKSFGRKELELFIAQKYIDEPTRIALEKIIELKDRVTAAEVRLQQINKEATEIAEDQLRLRENIKALTSTAEAKQLIARYVAKANDQETRLEQIEKERRTVIYDRARLQRNWSLRYEALFWIERFSKPFGTVRER